MNPREMPGGVSGDRPGNETGAANYSTSLSLFVDSLIEKVERLEEENAELKKRIYRLELEVDLGLD